MYKLDDKVIFYDNGEILEGTIKSIYIVKNGVFYDIKSGDYIFSDISERKVGKDNIINYVKTEVNKIENALKKYLLSL